MATDDSIARWKEHAYPLKQITIKLQGTRHSNNEDLIGLLKLVTRRLEEGREQGKAGDDDFGYLFNVESNVWQSIFDDSVQPCDQLNVKTPNDRLINPDELDFARNVAKRLDEHRELVMDLIEHTDFLADREATPWRAGRLATQDDYLMYLFFLRYGMWPDATNAGPARHCRPRPEILGTCGHPLYSR